MQAWQWTGERFEPCAGVPLSDRGFRYGMSLFESLCVAGGRPEFLEEHLARLLSAAAERGFVLEATPLQAAAGLLNGATGFARLYVTAGDGPPTAAADQPRIFVLLEDRALPDPADAWELTIHDDPYRPLFSGTKTSNYWFNADALTQAQRRGCDETLLFNDLGELVCAAMANVFLVRNQQVATPPRSSGCRAGVVRAWVIARRKVSERRLRREDVLQADEVFLTNSWIGVQPVATLEGRPLGPRQIGPQLAAEFARLRADLAAADPADYRPAELQNHAHPE